MAVFKFKTGSDFVKGEIDYTCTRYAGGYKISYTVYMKRTNSHSGTPSNGTIDYSVYVNGTAVNSGTKKGYTVPNNGNRAKIVSGTKQYTLDTFSTGSFTIGFSATKGTGSSKAFNVSKQTSGSVAVPAYAVRPSLSSLDIIYNPGDNYYTFKGEIGNSGSDNNKPTGCKVFYTTDGKNPTSKSLNFTITGTEKTTWEKQMSIPQKEGTQTIKARISTLAPLGGVDTPEDKSQLWTVAYYSVPYPLQNLNISYNTSRPTPNSTYTFQWRSRIDGSAGCNNPVVKYDIKIYVDNILKETLNVDRGKEEKDGDTKTIIRTGKELGLKKESKLKFSGRAIGSSAYNNTPISSRYSSEIPIESAGVAKIKTFDGWKEGQAWIKTNDGWKRSTGVYVKTSNGWKQSI